jgi:hypothetical protein
MIENGCEIALYALTKMSIYNLICDYEERINYLKTPRGIFEYFIERLLDQGMRPKHFERVIEWLKKEGLMDYYSLVFKLKVDPDALEKELRHALTSAGCRGANINPGAKAIKNAVEKVEKEYEGTLHNIYNYAVKKFKGNRTKIANDVWQRLNDFFWFKDKKAGVFLRDIVKFKIWDVSLKDVKIMPDTRVRRVLHKLKLVRDPNNIDDVFNAGDRLAKEISSLVGIEIAPSEIDLALWNIGDEKICGERETHCEVCPLNFCCPSSNIK